MNKSTFPTYCDYYYRCRIFNVEEAKREYTKCNDFLLGSDIVESPAMKILTDKPEEERKEIYEAYKKLCDDFKSIAQMIIDKDGIESEEDYIHGMELLMLIANRTIMFTSKEFCLHGGAYLKEKYVYAGKYMRLSEIIKKNDNTPYYLNPDDVATIFVDKYGTAILWIIGIMICLGGFKSLYQIIYISELQTMDSIIKAVLFDLFIALGLFICYIPLSSRGMVKYYEEKSKACSRNQYLVVHPYKTKFTLKNIKEVINILMCFKK